MEQVRRNLDTRTVTMTTNPLFGSTPSVGVYGSALTLLPLSLPLLCVSHLISFVCLCGWPASPSDEQEATDTDDAQQGLFVCLSFARALGAFMLTLCASRQSGVRQSRQNQHTLRTVDQCWR
jgi:hypothetical protein